MTPRGIRLNNPTNIRRVTGQTWVGQSAEQPDPDFVSFVAPQYCYRASAHIIMRHYVAAKTTVADVIRHWAPPTENDTVAYERSVTRRMALVAPAVLSLPAQLPELLHAITCQEQGQFPYDDGVVIQGIELDGTHMTTIAPVPDKPLVSPAMKAIALGSAKSKTITLGAAMAVLANLAPQAPALCQALNLDPHTTQAVGSFVAALMIVLRYLTNQSVADKSGLTADAAPPVSTVPFGPAEVVVPVMSAIPKETVVPLPKPPENPK